MFPANSFRKTFDRVFPTRFSTFSRPDGHRLRPGLDAEACGLEERITPVAGDGVFDLVVISQWYTPEEMSKFRDDVQRFERTFFDIEPFKSRQAQFNVHILETTKDLKPKLIEDRGLTVDRWLTTKLIEESGIRNDCSLVLINTEIYGGAGGGSIATSYNGSLVGLAATHELAHAFGELADEYSYGYDVPLDGKVQGNVFAGPPPAAEWSGLVADDEYYLGAYADNLYRTSENSLMRNLVPYFNAVSIEILNDKLDYWAGPVNDAVAPQISFVGMQQGQKVARPANGVVNFEATTSDNFGVTRAQLWVNGSLARNATQFPLKFDWRTANLTLGTYDLQLRAYDAAGNIGTSETFTVQLTETDANATATSLGFMNPVTYGDPWNVEASVASVMTSKVPTGTVQFKLDGVNYGQPVALVNGHASLWISAKKNAGTVNVEAVYQPTGTFSTSSSSKMLTIQKRPLEIGIKTAYRKIGTANPGFELTYSGFTVGDGPGNLTGTPVFTCSADANSPTGSYAVTASGLAADNYQITWKPGTLVVYSGDPVTVRTVAPFIASKKMARVDLAFSGGLDAASVIPAGFLVRSSGRDKVMGTGDDVTQVISGAKYLDASRTVQLTLKTPVALDRDFEVRVLDAALRDIYQQPIDGDGNGSPGGAATGRLNKYGGFVLPVPLAKIVGGSIVTSASKVSGFRIEFSGMPASDAVVRTGAYVITSAGVDGLFGTRDDKKQSVSRITFDKAKNTATVTLRQAQASKLKFRVTILSNSKTGVFDVLNRLIDGDGNGTAGGDGSIQF